MNTIKRKPVRKPSMQDLSTDLAIHSSDGTPSEHSSIYDASIGGIRLSEMMTSSETDDMSVRRDDPAAQEVRFVNKPNGTPLFTIVEQKSLSTLRTIPSNWTFQRRIVTFDPASSSSTSYKSNVEPQGTERRRCQSLDETTTRKLDAVQEFSQCVSSDNSTAQATASHLAERSKPATPPFAPPVRVTTPEGLPRWPGEVNYNPPRRVSTRAALLKYIRQRGRNGTSLRDVFHTNTRNAQAHPTATGRRYWRPPVSGHGTLRHDGLDNHPFAAANDEEPPLEHTQPPHARSSQDKLSPPNETSVDGPRQAATSPAQRALAFTQENAVTVPAARVQAASAARSVSMPKRKASPPLNTTTSTRPPSAIPSTVRTVDLLEQFPGPPEESIGDVEQQPNARGSKKVVKLSPFPKQALFAPKARPGAAVAGLLVGQNVATKTQQCLQDLLRTREVPGDGENNHPVSLDVAADGQEVSAVGQTVCHDTSSCAARREGVQRGLTAERSALFSPATGRGTSTSRYFSAASEMEPQNIAGSTEIAAPPRQNDEERGRSKHRVTRKNAIVTTTNRPIANVVRRLKPPSHEPSPSVQTSQHHTPLSHHLHSSNPSPRSPSLTPITLTSHARFCRHRLPSPTVPLFTTPPSQQPSNLDGTTDCSTHGRTPTARRASTRTATTQDPPTSPDCWKCRSILCLENVMRRLGRSCLCGYRAEVVSSRESRGRGRDAANTNVDADAAALPPVAAGSPLSNASPVVVNSRIRGMVLDDGEAEAIELELARRTAPGAKGRGHWTFRDSVAVPTGEVVRALKAREKEREERSRERGREGKRGEGEQERERAESALRHVGGIGVLDRPVGINGVEWGRNRLGTGHGAVEAGGEGEVVSSGMRPAEWGRGSTQMGFVTGPEGGLVPVKVRHRSEEHEEVSPLTRQANGVRSGGQRAESVLEMGPALALPKPVAVRGDAAISAPPSPVPAGLHDGFPRRQST